MQVNASNYQPNACPATQSRVQSKSDTAVFTVNNSGTESKDASKDTSRNKSLGKSSYLPMPEIVERGI